MTPVRPVLRSLAMLVLLALSAAACATGGGGAGTADVPAGAVPPDTPTGVEAGSHEAVEPCTPGAQLPGGDVERATVLDREFPWLRNDPVVLPGFDDSRIISGGPPPDGIRPIDEPCFEAIAAADEWLEGRSPVLVVEVDGDRRAYPLAIMTQHEIVNDVVGGVPVTVTYCPLCNSGLVFERTVDGQVLDFGTSGRLYQSNLVMYDRQTKSLWTQFTGQAVVGADHVGTELVRVPTSLLHWGAFAADGRGVVLSRDSFPDRSYGRNPYPGYEGAGDAFLFEGPRDDTLPPNTRVIGLGTDRDPIAVPLERLQTERIVELEVAGDPVSMWWVPGQASALDRALVDDGVDVGSVVVFSRVLGDGRVLTFQPAETPDRVVDEQTGSIWTLFGEAVAGELAGEVLDAVSRDDTFWFVWFAFQPDTTVAAGS